MADTNNNNKKLAEELKKPSSQQYLEELEKLSVDPQYSTAVPEQARATLQDAINQAREARDAEIKKSEWLDVAQNLGRAIAQFGAAQAGMRSGRDLSRLDMGPTIDYGSRADRAMRRYSQDVASAEKLQEEEQARAGSAREAYGRREAYLREALRGAREKESEEARAQREREADASRERRESLREALRQKQDADRMSIQDKKLELTDLNRQEMEIRKQLEAARSIANSAAIDEDLSNKSKDRLAEKYGALSARAGVDPAVLSNIGEQSKDTGILGTGILRGEDKEKKAKLLEEQVVAPIRNMLESIQARKRELITGGQAPTAPVESEESAAGRQQAGELGPEPTEDQINKYVSMYPQISKEQARDILKKRLAGGR